MDYRPEKVKCQGFTPISPMGEKDVINGAEVRYSTGIGIRGAVH